MIRSVSNKNKLKAHARSFALNSLLLPFKLFCKVYTASKRCIIVIVRERGVKAKCASFLFVLNTPWKQMDKTAYQTLMLKK